MITVSKQFETEEASAWLERPAPQIAGGPVTDQEVARAKKIWTEASTDTIGWRGALTDFYVRRSISTETALRAAGARP